MSILADAMIPDAASSEPRKRSWKRWIVALACVVAVAIVALLANTPKKEPVKVWFVNSTNHFGYKELVFQGTNGIPRQIWLSASVFTGAIHQAKAPAGLSPPYYSDIAWPAAGTNFSFTLWKPRKDVSCYVMWHFDDFSAPATRWKRFRVRCYCFFRMHRMPALARPFEARAEVHYIPSTELKE